MRALHILRKYNPAQWGGTETAVLQLTSGLRQHGVESAIYCPELEGGSEKGRDATSAAKSDPLAEAGNEIKRYKAIVPVARISPEQRAQLVSIGGNLMSFDLIWQLFREPADVIHSHAMNRIGGIGLTAAHFRKLPFVVTIHGGALDLPQQVKEQLAQPLEGGLEWGKVFGAPLRSRRVLPDADAILTCNKSEAALLEKKYPGKRIIVHPHGVQLARYVKDQREAALQAFPTLRGKRYLFVLGRVDPVKNQGWLLEQLPTILQKHPDVSVVFAGACTDEQYGKKLKKDSRAEGMEERVLFAGALPPGDARLVGLLQGAAAVVVPSLSETFGLVILEGWAAQRPVLASRTSGATDLIEDGLNGNLFDLQAPANFHSALNRVLTDADYARKVASLGYARAQEFDTVGLAGRIKELYAQLREEKRR
jgi:glycosyltransferase involved in cell wall biosynthesis